MSDQANSEEFTGSAGTVDDGTGELQRGRGHGRRAVMLGAAAVGVGTVASMAVPAEAAVSQTRPEPLSVAVAVHPQINVDQIAQLVARIGGLVGCRTCGLLGVDLRLLGVDPAEAKEAQVLAKIPGVASAVLTQQ